MVGPLPRALPWAKECQPFGLFGFGVFTLLQMAKPFSVS